MREIKFRAWDKVSKKMVDLQTLTPVALATKPHLAGAWAGIGVYVPDHTDIKVMQYIGLNDKGGAGIYEGDIIDDEFNCGQLKLIKYDNKKACFISFWIGGVAGTPYEAPISISPKTISKGKVVGNIYENPKLLNK
jgi:uncharacterized phage protein (TIGR01671 family)